VAAAAAAIRSFAAAVQSSRRQFAFDCNPDYGQGLFCFDTEENSLRFAKEHGDDLASRRRERVDYANKLEYAINAIEYPCMPMVPFNNNVGDYAHQGFAEHTFADWSDFRFSNEYPGDFASSNEDYLSSAAKVAPATYQSFGSQSLLNKIPMLSMRRKLKKLIELQGYQNNRLSHHPI
jgi:hypothetical protein